jgi:hypothetical protein
MRNLKKFVKLNNLALFDVSKNYRKIPIELYCIPLGKNKQFISDAATPIATEHNCDLIAIRAEVHNTKSTLTQVHRNAPVQVAPRSNLPGGPRHGAMLAVPRGGRAPDPTIKNKRFLQKTYEDAPWHITAEFRRRAACFAMQHGFLKPD